MREYINTNLKVIKKHIKKRVKNLSNLNRLSIVEEFKEWEEEKIFEKELIWTLPDLTSVDRLNNFCRSIKKRIN